MKFKCECGFETNNPQQFNGHKSFCRIHLGEDAYQQQIKRNRLKQQSMLDAKQKKFAELERAYYEAPKRCKECGEIILYQERQKDFCNSSCSAKYNNARRIREPKEWVNIDGTCKFCGKPGIGRYSKYCSNTCYAQDKRKKWISGWLSGEIIGSETEQLSVYIEDYIREKYNHKCAQCGWDKVNPVLGKCWLEIHHIDGDDTNNKEENLILLCPNCHSLTPNFRNINNRRRKTKHR